MVEAKPFKAGWKQTRFFRLWMLFQQHRRTNPRENMTGRLECPEGGAALSSCSSLRDAREAPCLTQLGDGPDLCLLREMLRVMISTPSAASKRAAIHTYTNRCGIPHAVSQHRPSIQFTGDGLLATKGSRQGGFIPLEKNSKIYLFHEIELLRAGSAGAEGEMLDQVRHTPLLLRLHHGPHLCRIVYAHMHVRTIEMRVSGQTRESSPRVPSRSSARCAHPSHACI